jgi:Zn ribbon nucleic-acid-binding protein
MVDEDGFEVRKCRACGAVKLAALFAPSQLKGGSGCHEECIECSRTRQKNSWWRGAKAPAEEQLVEGREGPGA